MNTNELDYDLPEHLIAQHPAGRRSEARLLILNRQSGAVEHRSFGELGDYLQSRDALVLNESRVLPARFYLRRGTGGRIQALFLNLTPAGAWQVLLKNAHHLGAGEMLTLIENPGPAQNVRGAFSFTLGDHTGEGHFVLQPEFDAGHQEILGRVGKTPLPPYIKRSADEPDDPVDRCRYQTVYAQKEGSVAAPTAGLHFTDEMLQELRRRGVRIARLTLHVGIGTFRPVSTDTLEAHTMHAESYYLDRTSAELINQTLAEKRRVVAVGTTSVRTLETLAADARIGAGSGQTDLFITPGYTFNIVGGMITNFHLPRSTLLALVCAFAGTENTLNAYHQAVAHQYRFYSYGDAMLILA